MLCKFNRAITVSMSAVAMALSAQPAVAQDASAASDVDGGLGDIVVTARKVGEASQSLPITIAAFSGEELTNKVVLTAQDLQAITPGLTISNNPTGGVPIFAIRGTATELGIEGGVALYFNDVPLFSTVGIMNAFYDVSTVEVLKGPQGTQFGTNTTGGTISVRTNLPTDEFEGYVKAGYGNFNRREVEGVINIPINDVVGLRLAGNYVKRDGYVKNPDNAGVRPKDFQDENHYSLRGTLSLDSGPIQNVLIVDYYNRDEKPFGTIPVKFATSLLGVNLPALGAKLGDYNTIHVGPNFSGVNLPLFGKAKLFGIQNRTNIDLSDNLSLRNVIGFRHDHPTTSEDTGGNSVISVGVLRETKTDYWTDDLTLRFTSNDGRLRAALGGYLSLIDWSTGFNVNVLQGLFAAFGLPATYVSSTNNFEIKKYNSKALYFNADYDITETLGVNGGIRYNWDSVHSRVTAGTGPAIGRLPKFSYEFFPRGDFACAAGNMAGYPTFNPATCSATREASFKAPSWTVGLTNKFSDKVLAYAKISHGYLSGGTNFTLRDPGRTTFEPEKNTMIEAGVKADWFLGDRPIRTNIAIYHGKISNKQVFANANYGVGGTGFGVVNAAKETVYGADVEMRFSPFEGMTLDLGYNYIHAKFDKFIYPALGSGSGAVPAVDLSGATPSQTPKHQLNVAATYAWPVSDNTGKISTTVSGYYTSAITQSNRLGAFDNLVGGELNELPGYFLANASLNWENALNSPVSVQLWIRNAFNKHYRTASNIQFATFGWGTNVFGAPRTFGVNATLEF